MRGKERNGKVRNGEEWTGLDRRGLEGHGEGRASALRLFHHKKFIYIINTTYLHN